MQADLSAEAVCGLSADCLLPCLRLSARLSAGCLRLTDPTVQELSAEHARRSVALSARLSAGLTAGLSGQPVCGLSAEAPVTVCEPLSGAPAASMEGNPMVEEYGQHHRRFLTARQSFRDHIAEHGDTDNGYPFAFGYLASSVRGDRTQAETRAVLDGLRAGLKESQDRAAGSRCPDCGHIHAGPALAGICVGCPCPTGGVVTI